MTGAVGIALSAVAAVCSIVALFVACRGLCVDKRYLIMTKQELLPYLFFYKGEDEMPSEIATNNEEQLWIAEKYVFDALLNKIGPQHPKEDIALWIESYVGKWNPYGWEDVMSTYYKRANAG